MVTVSRAVVILSRQHHPEGRRFFVKSYPKDKEWRRFRMSDQIVRKLSAHVTAYGLASDELLFARRGSSRDAVGRSSSPIRKLSA